MYSPASYTLLGISLTLATLSLVGTGGVKWWYLKEVLKAGKDNDGGRDFSARCRSSAASGNDASAGLDLDLSQEDDDDRVVIEGIIDRNNADGILQLLLSTDTSCSSPENFISGIFSESDDDDGESEIDDWSVHQDLDDTIGNVIVVQDASDDQLGCCIVRRRRR